MGWSLSQSLFPTSRRIPLLKVKVNKNVIVYKTVYFQFLNLYMIKHIKILCFFIKFSWSYRVSLTSDTQKELQTGKHLLTNSKKLLRETGKVSNQGYFVSAYLQFAKLLPSAFITNNNIFYSSSLKIFTMFKGLGM